MATTISDHWVIKLTGRAPSNIAVIKYWGKRDEDKILPLNSSLSVTLDPSHLSATTTVAISPSFSKDRLWLNGKEVSLTGVRYQNCLSELRNRANDVYDEKSGVTVKKERWQDLKFHIVSSNNFPTAAGLASSAAGFACLVFSLANLMGVKESFPGELTAIARMGSGSACRSLDGGFVKWNMGERDDGSDSYAEQIRNESHWPDLRIIVAVVSDLKKETSSTAGMKESVKTSPLLAFRAQSVVPQRIQAMEEAIRKKDFTEFSRLTCVDSNQFHAVCLDSFPPIFYLNDTSKRLIQMAEFTNRENKEPIVAYTFDAGPNAVFFVQSKNAASFLKRILSCFPPPPNKPISEFIVGDQSLVEEAGITSLLNFENDSESSQGLRKYPGELQYLICTRPGAGARVLEAEEDSLVHPVTGLPKFTAE